MLAVDVGTSAVWSNSALLQNTISNRDQNTVTKIINSNQIEEQQNVFTSNQSNYRSDRNDNNFGLVEASPQYLNHIAVKKNQADSKDFNVPPRAKNYHEASFKDNDNDIQNADPQP